MSSQTDNQKVNAAIGTVFMAAGAVCSCLVFMDRWTEIPLPVPGIWHDLRSFHVLICVACFALGAWAHRLAGRKNDGEEAVFRSVTVYSKPDCELCDHALDVLHDFAAFLPAINVVDISADPALMEQHAMTVPVVEIDGRIRFRGIVSHELLQRLIEAARNKQSGTPVSDDNSP